MPALLARLVPALAIAAVLVVVYKLIKANGNVHELDRTRITFIVILAIAVISVIMISLFG